MSCAGDSFAIYIQNRQCSFQNSMRYIVDNNMGNYMDIFISSWFLRIQAIWRSECHLKPILTLIQIYKIEKQAVWLIFSVKYDSCIIVITTVIHISQADFGPSGPLSLFFSFFFRWKLEWHQSIVQLSERTLQAATFFFIFFFYFLPNLIGEWFRLWSNPLDFDAMISNLDYVIWIKKTYPNLQCFDCEQK